MAVALAMLVPTEAVKHTQPPQKRAIWTGYDPQQVRTESVLLPEKIDRRSFLGRF